MPKGDTKPNGKSRGDVKRDVEWVMTAARDYFADQEKSSIPEVRDTAKVTRSYLTVAAWHIQIGVEHLFPAETVKVVEARGREALEHLQRFFSP